jgi:hypothetical protein
MDYTTVKTRDLVMLLSVETEPEKYGPIVAEIETRENWMYDYMEDMPSSVVTPAPNVKPTHGEEGEAMNDKQEPTEPLRAAAGSAFCKLALPTTTEIMMARGEVSYPPVDQENVMRCWAGQCWHTDEILFGILIGLRIAEKRMTPNDELSDRRRNRHE